jgi:hypothetical protein
MTVYPDRLHAYLIAKRGFYGAKRKPQAGMGGGVSAASPCPFCGGSIRSAQSPISQEWRVSCVQCWAAGPPAATEIDSVTKWNVRRALRVPE